MRLGYLYSRYPVLSQTFCDAEMLALERLGFELEIGSVYPPLTSLRHEHIACFRAAARNLKDIRAEREVGRQMAARSG
jgi:hypothetical protein